MSDPLILAFDTSAAHCAAALLSGDRVLARVAEAMPRGQAERLMGLLHEVLSGSGHDWRDLDAIGVGIGPGNFTGIRISVSAARGLALGLGVPAYGVLLEGIALAGPMDREGDWIAGQGMRPHDDTLRAAVALNTRDGRLLVALWQEGAAPVLWGRADAALPGPIAAVMALR